MGQKIKKHEPIPKGQPKVRAKFDALMEDSIGKNRGMLLDGTYWDSVAGALAEMISLENPYKRETAIMALHSAASLGADIGFALRGICKMLDNGNKKEMAAAADALREMMLNEKTESATAMALVDRLLNENPDVRIKVTWALANTAKSRGNIGAAFDSIKEVMWGDDAAVRNNAILALWWSLARGENSEKAAEILMDGVENGDEKVRDDIIGILTGRINDTKQNYVDKVKAVDQLLKTSGFPRIAERNTKGYKSLVDAIAPALVRMRGAA
ncbi:MAG: HEAT repeat domain-containing protein [Candidatus Bilamarchaeaceae archaeon]